MIKSKKLSAVILMLVFSLTLGACKHTTVNSNVSKTESTPITDTKTDAYSDLKEETAPHISGTFIQSWLCSSWDDQRWAKELTHYNEIGIEYIIMGDTATYDKKSKTWTSYYDTQLEELKQGSVYKNTIENALRNCQKYGIKVFVGMGSDTNYWDNLNNADWMQKTMEKSKQICTELYTLYYEKYKDAFYGWYWVPEIWNDTSYGKYENREQNIQVLANSMSMCLDHLTSLNPNMPMLWSPFVNVTTYMTADDTYLFWRDVIKSAHFRAGDIICPMDGINQFEQKYDGKSGCEITGLDTWDKLYRRAVDDSGKGVKFWANCESFNDKLSPAEPALWARYVRQMQIASKYAEKIITFAYAHYESPYNVNSYIAETYQDYLKNGKLETTPPTKPENLSMKIENGVGAFDWTPSTDNFGVAGYYIYRDGEMFDQCYTQLNQTNTPISIGFTDWDIAEIINEKGKVTYEVLAYDSAGNYSEKAILTLTKEDLKNKL